VGEENRARRPGLSTSVRELDCQISRVQKHISPLDSWYKLRKLSTIYNILVSLNRPNLMGQNWVLFQPIMEYLWGHI